MTATKFQPGDDTHLTLLMAPHSLNFVTGADRAALLAYGRDVFAAARDSKCLAQIEEPATLAGTTIEQYARMFNEACEALGKISDGLGIDSDIDPGAEPIIAAIEQLRTGSTHPVLDDRWKARMLDGRAPERDEMGFGNHPELPSLDEGMMPRSFFAALGLELAHTSAEDQLDWGVLGAMSEAVNWTDWLPTPPHGDGWKLVSIFDTEDGPVAWWLRELPEAEDGTTTIRNLQAEVENLKASAARVRAAPAAVAPFGYVNTYTGQFLFDVEPCRKDNEGHWRTVYLQPAAVAPQGGYPPLPEPVADWVQRGSVSIGGGSLGHEISREVVFTAAQMRAYFDLGRQPAAAPALEAPAAPALVGDEQADAYLTEPGRLESLARSHPAGLVRALARAMLAAAPQAPAAPWKDHQTARLVNDLRDCAIKYHGAGQLRERIAHIVVPLCDQLKGALAAPAAPSDPMDWPLPCDVTVGHGTIRKGCKLRTLVLRMQVLYQLAQETELAAPAAPAEGEVLVEVIGLTGSGKSAICGEIEILCRALGLDVSWPDGDPEKNMTHAEWTAAIEAYKPRVRIVERNVPRQSNGGPAK